MIFARIIASASHVSNSNHMKWYWLGKAVYDLKSERAMEEDDSCRLEESACYFYESDDQ